MKTFSDVVFFSVENLSLYMRRFSTNGLSTWQCLDATRGVLWFVVTQLHSHKKRTQRKSVALNAFSQTTAVYANLFLGRSGRQVGNSFPPKMHLTTKPLNIPRILCGITMFWAPNKSGHVVGCRSFAHQRNKPTRQSSTIYNFPFTQDIHGLFVQWIFHYVIFLKNWNLVSAHVSLARLVVVGLKLMGLRPVMCLTSHPHHPQVLTIWHQCVRSSSIRPLFIYSSKAYGSELRICFAIYLRPRIGICFRFKHARSSIDTVSSWHFVGQRRRLHHIPMHPLECVPNLWCGWQNPL